MESDGDQVERPADVGEKPADVVTRWRRELDAASSHEKKWRDRAEKVVEKYRNDSREDVAPQGFNILFANTEVLKGVMYSKPPVPDVRRRFLDKDPVGRDAADILQRSLSYLIDSYDFDFVAESVVQDVLLPGRGVAYVEYDPTIESHEEPMLDEYGNETYGEDEQPLTETLEEVVYEEVTCKYCEWDMFRMSSAKQWSKVRWVAFGELLTRDELAEQFGDLGTKCELDWSPKGAAENDDFLKRALVWTIWDKDTRTVLMICKGSPDAPLRTAEDPLRLEGFFPTPRPLLGIWTTNSTIPIPEFLQYQDQALELENVTQRIDALVDALRRRGVYDSQFEELAKLADAADNVFVPVENYAAMAEKGGVANLMVEMPIEGIAKVIVHLYDQRDRIKQVIYEITGIADIVRGATNSNETLGAQELKSRYANSRIGTRQKAIGIYLRDLLRLKAEIVSEHFSPKTLSLMTGQEVGEEVMQLLRNDKMRGFKVDIETDSTIIPDANNEQKNRINFLDAVVKYIAGVAPMVQSGAIPLQLAKEFLSFAARSFKIPPQLEEALDKLGEKPEGDSETEKLQQKKAVALGYAEVEQAQADVAKTAAETQKLGAQVQEIGAKSMRPPPPPRQVQGPGF